VKNRDQIHINDVVQRNNGSDLATDTVLLGDGIAMECI